MSERTRPSAGRGFITGTPPSPELAIGIAGRQRFFFGERGERLLTLGLRITCRVEID